MAADITHSNLNLTPEEKRAYGKLYQQADAEGLGVVTGDVAVRFFERTGLNGTVLGEIWQMADTENRGLLTPAGFSVVLRLIGHCQAGREPSPELALRPGPLPKFNGLNTISQPQTPTVPAPATSLDPQNTGGPIRVPPLTPDRAGEYFTMFDRAGARNGVLAGDAARQMFEKARLPNEVLGRIWSLADIEQRGALNVTEFVVAMHLLTSMKSGALRALPQSLPPGLYDAASRRGLPPSGPPGGIPRQFTGPSPQGTQSPMSTGRPPFVTPPPTVTAQITGNDWLITPQDKLKFDQVFATVDRAGRGYITGDQAVQFFSTSGLSEDALASIWDLADINSEGQLSQDKFAVAMYLIRQQRSKKDNRDSLPTSLPPTLIPPRMRQRSIASSQPTAPTFDNAVFAPQQAKSASDDLFGLDVLAPGSPESQQAAPKMPEADLFGSTNAASPTSPPGFQTSTPVPRDQGTLFKPFMPTSTFGQGLTQQNTGGSVQSGFSSNRGMPQPQPSTHHDLLGDNDPEASSKLNEETTALATMSNQTGNLRTQMREVQNTKATTEKDLNWSSTQKRELEARLSQFRSQYEQEVQEVKALAERLVLSQTETRKLQQELAMIEGAHEDLKAQHEQTGNAFEADQRENVILKERIRDMNIEIPEIKSKLENVRSEARQLKGLVAINKKQLATSEGERDKLKAEVSDLEKANAEKARSLQSAHQVTSSSTTSPAASNAGQSMNPFFRKSPQQSFDRTMSPANFTQTSGGIARGQNAFDSFFGPSNLDAQSTEPPHTTFPGDSQRNRGLNTPDVSAPPTPAPPTSSQDYVRASGPPPPSESRQIDSSALPVGTSLDRSESTSSSVRAVAPASRTGLSSNATPARFADSPADLTEGVGADTREQGASSGLVGRTSPAAAGTGSRTIMPSSVTDYERDTDSRLSGHAPSMETFISPVTESTLVPGAFPDVDSPAQSTPTGGSTASTSSRMDERRGETFATDRSRHQAFSTQNRDTAVIGSGGFRKSDEEVRPASGSDALAGRAIAAGGVPQAEFPPIHDLHHDDDSDTDSDHGFDDNFTSASPPQFPRDSIGTRGQPNLPPRTVGMDDNLSPSHLAAHRVESDSSQLPAPGAQQSLPVYREIMSPSDTAGHGQESNQFPPDFGGLLHSRQISSSPPQANQMPAITEGQFSQSRALQYPQNGDREVSLPQAFPFSSSHEQQAPPSATNSTFLGKSLYMGQPIHSGQPSTANPAPSDAFDFDFDDLSEAKEADDQSHETFAMAPNHHDDHEFNPVFDSPAHSKVTTGSYHTPTREFGSMNDSPDTFTDTFESFGASQPGGSAKAAQRSDSTPHDWDSIFSGLDSSTTHGQSNDGKTPFSFNDTGPSFSRGPAPAPQQRLAPPGRAMTGGTEHDDPILKSLTSMGYARNDALTALEKYDYNLDKAADYLTSKR